MLQSPTGAPNFNFLQTSTAYGHPFKSPWSTPLRISIWTGVHLISVKISHQPTKFNLPTNTCSKAGDHIYPQTFWDWPSVHLVGVGYPTSPLNFIFFRPSVRKLVTRSPPKNVEPDLVLALLRSRSPTHSPTNFSSSYYQPFKLVIRPTIFRISVRSGGMPYLGWDPSTSHQIRRSD